MLTQQFIMAVSTSTSSCQNSNRCIEVEVGSIFVQDILFNSSSTHLPSTSISGSIVPHNLRKFVLSDDDNIQVPYQHSFFVLYILSYSYEDKFECQMIVDRGDVDDWPLQFMHPKKRNVRIKAAFLGELLTFFDGLYGNKCEYVQPRITKYGRCTVNGQTFSSDFNSTDRGSIVKAMFVEDNNELAPYFGIVRFYFTINTVIEQQHKSHHLAYVSWLKFRSHSPEQLSNLYRVTNQTYKSDRIISPRRFLCRCVLVSPRQTIPQYLVSELPK